MVTGLTKNDWETNATQVERQTGQLILRESLLLTPAQSSGRTAASLRISVEKEIRISV